MKGKPYTPLTDAETDVIVGKQTELPFSGGYWNYWQLGIYVCRRCGTPLFSSEAKFDAGCGWPSFEDTFPGAVRETADADVIRTEITCAVCGAHLGHVFRGEKMTSKDTRHCVNSVSIRFIPERK